MASGFFFPGTVSARASWVFVPPPGVGIHETFVFLWIDGPGGRVFDSGLHRGTTALSGSASNLHCGATYTATAGGYFIGTDGNNYAGPVPTVTISGVTVRPLAGGSIASPAPGVQTARPATVTGTGWASSVILRDLATSVDTALVVVAGPASWTANLPGLTMGRGYRITAVFEPGPSECAASATRTVEFSLPVRFVRRRTWRIAYAIGPLLSRRWRVVYPISIYLERRWRVIYQVDSPFPVPATEAAIAAALRPLHTFRARLFVRWDRVTWSEETERLLSASGVDDIDLVTRALNSAEAVFELDNGDDRFTPTNPVSPIAPTLHRIGHEVRLVAGYDGHEDVAFFGYLESLRPRAEDKSATIRALDRTSLWRTLRVSFAPAVHLRTDEIMRSLLTSVGLVDGVDFGLDVGDVTVPYAVASVTPLLPELGALAQAEGGRLFLDSGGVLRFWSASRTRRAVATPVVALDTDQHLYRIERGSDPAGLATRVTMEWVTREPAAPETIYDLRHALRIPAGWFDGDSAVYRPGAPITIEAAPMDLTRWERHIPAVFESMSDLVANTARDGTGTAVATVEGSAPVARADALGPLHFRVFLHTGFALVIFENTRPVPVFVLPGLRFAGRPQRTVSPTSVTVADPDAVLAYGDIEHRMANPYTPDADTADTIVREELARRRDPLARLLIPLSDGLAFLRPLDVLRVTDGSIPRFPVVTDGQVVRNAWRMSPDVGYTQDLVLAPALPAQYRGIDSLPSIRDAVRHWTDAPPWRWSNPYYEGHLRRSDVVHPWRNSPVPRAYSNAATLLVSTDIPEGNPTAWSCLFRWDGTFDAMGFVALPAPMRAGVTYVVRFWLRRTAGTGRMEWIVGDHTSAIGGRVSATWQTSPTTWEERSIAWAPLADCPDPMLALKPVGSEVSDVAVARVTVTHGAPAKLTRWSAGGHWQ